MIIFNFYAIAVGLIIAIIVGPIYWLMPDDFANGAVGQIILLAIGSFVAGLCELGGLKGRLFFLPMWILGVLGTLGYTFMEFSWKGIGILAGVLVAIIGLIFLLVYLSEKKDWKNAYANFAELKKMKNTQEKAFWEQVEKAKFFPSMMNYDHRMCEHNFEVLAYLKFIGLEWEEIEALIPVFQDASVAGNKIDINSELTDAFEARLSEELEKFETEE
ncbi:MAG: hypothetical protein H6579_02980 [Chitinophagales bacterium]|nr:hypothetical protein [Chitinophagales bacterium]